MSHLSDLSWREALKELCDSPQKKQEIAEKVGSSVRTIDRWISGETVPQRQESIRNLAALSDELGDLLHEQWPEAFETRTARVPLPIERATLPEEFMRRVLHSYAHTARKAQRWTIYRLVCSQMLAHLDPERVGLMIVYVRQHIPQMETLQLFERAGSSIWATRQVIEEVCSEPWIVQAVNDSRPLFVQSLSDALLPPPSCFANADRIQSLGFFPLYRSGCAGGGIIIVSATPDFFTPLRQSLLEEYCHLLALAFRDTDFQ
jgi:transcriptional regulator with XRE-family HTH domain